jgi:hypothetical protein
MRRQLAIVLALAMPCIGRAQPTHDGRVPLEIGYGGCRELVHGACAMRADGELRLWVRTTVDAQVAIGHGRSVVRPDSGAAVQGGLRYVFVVQPDDALVTVRVTGADAASAWSLPLVSYQRSDVAQRAADLVAKSDLAGARALLEALDAPDGDALGLLGRIRNLQGETEAARVTLRAAIARDLADGREQAAVTDATVLAYSLMVKGRQFGAARAELDRFDDGPDASAEQRYFLAYFRGLLAYNSGDDRGTLRQLGVASDEAARMGWDRLQLTAEQMLAVQLQMLGRRAEASAMLAAWQERLELLASDCERVFLSNVGADAAPPSGGQRRKIHCPRSEQATRRSSPPRAATCAMRTSR